MKKKEAAGTLRYQRKRGFHHFWRKWIRAPNYLGCIDLERRQHTRDHADQHRCKHDVPARVFDFLGKCGDGIETDVSENGNGGSAEHAREAERSRIVKRLREKSGAIFVKPPDETNDKRKKDDDNDHRARGKDVVDARRCLDPPQIQRRKRERKADSKSPIRHARKDIL